MRSSRRKLGLPVVGTAKVSLAGMATPADSNVATVAESEVFDIINFVAIYYENSASGNAEQRFSEGK